MSNYRPQIDDRKHEQLWDETDDLFSKLFVKEDSSLQAALGSHKPNGLPEINVAPNQGKLLNFLVRMNRASTILEIGTLAGYSTIWLGKALPEGGSVTTLEFNPDYAQLARANIERAGLKDSVEVVVGDALETLPKLVEQGRVFDFVFIDAEKTSYVAYLEQILKMCKVGTVIVADNVVRQGKIARPEETTDERVHGALNYLKRIASEPRLDSDAIQTVGNKGYDGLSISIVIN